MLQIQWIFTAAKELWLCVIHQSKPWSNKLSVPEANIASSFKIALYKHNPRKWPSWRALKAWHTWHTWRDKEEFKEPIEDCLTQYSHKVGVRWLASWRHVERGIDLLAATIVFDNKGSFVALVLRSKMSAVNLAGPVSSSSTLVGWWVPGMERFRYLGQSLCGSRLSPPLISLICCVLYNAAVYLKSTSPHLREKGDGHHYLGHHPKNTDFPTHILFGPQVASCHRWTLI